MGEQREAERGEGVFLILSLKERDRQPGMPLTWWGPSGCGYTRYVDEAGRYTQAECLADRRLHGHHLTQAVPEALVLERVMEAPPVCGGERMRRPGGPVVHQRHRHFLNRDRLSATPDPTESHAG